MAYYYDSSEKILVEQFISEQIGPVITKLSDKRGYEMAIDILLVESFDEAHRFLITRGVGAVPLQVPDYLMEQRMNRVELVLRLSPDFHEVKRLSWPVQIMYDLGRRPLEDRKVLSDLSLISFEGDLVQKSNYGGALLIHCTDCHLQEPSINLPRGDQVILLEVLLLPVDELAWTVEHGAEDYLRRVYDQLPLTADAPRNSLLKRALEADESRSV